MAPGGRRPRKELRTYIPLIIQKIRGKARPIDIKRYFDQRISPHTSFRVSYNTIVKYCEQLCDAGILVRQVVLNNVERVRKDGRRRWMISMYSLVHKETEVVVIEKQV